MATGFVYCQSDRRARVRSAFLANLSGVGILRLIGTIFSLCFGLSLIAWASASHAQTLAEALQMGLSVSDRVEADKSSVDAAREQRNQVASQKRMRVQAELAWGDRRDTAESLDFLGRVNERTVTTPRNTVALFISQPIYTGGRLREGLRASDLRILAAEARVASSELTVMRNIATIYVDLVRARDSAKIIADSLTAVAEDVRGARARNIAGEVSITDVAQSEARQASIVAQSARAFAEVASATASFERLVGVTPDQLEADLVAPDLPKTLAEFEEAALAGNLEINQARITQAQSEAAARAAGTQRNPTISLDSSYTQRRNEAFSGSRATNASIEARLVVPLWDGGNASARVRELLASANASRLQVRDLERDVRLRANRLWADLVSARAQVTAIETQVAAAELARRGAVAEQIFGLRSTIEALNQELELRQARIAAATAKRDLYVAMIDIMALTGRAVDDSRPNSIDPRKKSALPPPGPPKPSLLEKPLITVQEFLEENDAIISRTMFELNKSLEPRQKQGPPL